MKENSNFYKLGEVRQSPVRVSLSHLASQHEAALCAAAGKSYLFGLVRICRASEDKKRQLCELNNVVANRGPDA